MDAKTFITNLLESADVRINGKRDQDIFVKDKRFYKRIIRDGNLGLGES